MDYVLMTKIYFGKHAENTNGVNCQARTPRKHLIEGLNRSLKNLNHDYVDVLFCHRYDNETPVLEVVQTMKDIISSGKAHYWGTSEWPCMRIMEAMHLADKVGCPRPIVEQCHYNMLSRDKMEVEYRHLIDEYGLGTTTFSPLASGILTGKYNDGIPEDSRLAKTPSLAFLLDMYTGGEANKQKWVAMMKGLKEVADELNCTLAQLGLAWTFAPKWNTCCLIGASSVKQLNENFKALNVVEKLRDPVMSERIENILNNRPKQWRPLPNLPAEDHRR